MSAQEKIRRRIKEIGADQNGYFTDGRWGRFAIEGPRSALREGSKLKLRDIDVTPETIIDIPIKYANLDELNDDQLVEAFERIVRQWSKQM